MWLNPSLGSKVSDSTQKSLPGTPTCGSAFCRLLPIATHALGHRAVDGAEIYRPALEVVQVELAPCASISGVLGTTVPSVRDSSGGMPCAQTRASAFPEPAPRATSPAPLGGWGWLGEEVRMSGFIAGFRRSPQFKVCFSGTGSRSP